ncbi:ComE operon protein 3 [bacterium HR26]|nr:ComE operon protein 3 [bacterium HR26]
MPRGPRARRVKPRLPAWLLVLGLLLLAAFTLLARSGWFPGPGVELRRSSGQTTIAFLDVGQALAVAVVTTDGHALLYDAGNSARDVREVIAPFFEARGVTRLDYLLLSHPDQDHVGGMPAVIEAFPIGTFLDPALPSTNLAYLETLERVADRGIPAQRARRGQAFTLGEQVRFEILWPRDPLLRAEGDEVADNDNALVVRLVHGAVTILLTGDIEAPAEHELVVLEGDGLRAPVLQVPHHGSQTSTTPELLEAVRPEVSVISAGAGNPYGHPHAEVVNRLRAAGSAVYRTDVDGTVIIETDGASYRVQVERGEADGR